MLLKVEVKLKRKWLKVFSLQTYGVKLGGVCKAQVVDWSWRRENLPILQ